MFNIYAISDLGWWLNGLYFLLVVVGIWLIPGLVLTKKVKFEREWQHGLLALGLTMSGWIIQALIFGYLQVRWMTYVYVTVMIIISIINIKYFGQWIKKIGRIKKSGANITIIILMALGMTIQILPISTSGWRDTQTRDIGWRYSNSVDGMMHLSFISEMAQNFPPNRPDAAREKLTNYHYLSDLWLADTARIFRLPINHLFFHYTPLLISLLTALAAVSVVKIFTEKKSAVIYTLLLVFFASDSAYLIFYWLHHYLAFRTPIFDAGMEQFLNYPQTLAKLLFFMSGWLLFREKKLKREWVMLWLISLPIVGVKIYYGAFYLAGLGLVCLVNIIREKKLFSPLSGLGLATLAASLAIYKTGNSAAGSLVWIPLVWSEQLMQPTNLDDIGWILIHQATHILRPLGLVKHYAWGVMVGILSMIGWRVIGLIYFMKKPKKKWMLWAFCLIPTLIFMTLSINTMQNPGGFNTFNFGIVAANVLIIPTALLLSKWWQKEYLRWLPVGIMLLMLPRNIELVKKYGGDLLFNIDKPELVISREEEMYLQELKETLPEGVIIQPAKHNHSAYVYFFTNRYAYLDGMPITGYKEIYEPREEKLQDILENGDRKKLKTELGIDYWYTPEKIEEL